MWLYCQCWSEVKSRIGALNLFVCRYSYFGDKCTYHVCVKCNIDDKILIFFPILNGERSRNRKVIGIRSVKITIRKCIEALKSLYFIGILNKPFALIFHLQILDFVLGLSIITSEKVICFMQICSRPVGKQVHIFASFSRDIENDRNKDFQIELICNKMLGFTLLVPFHCYVITVGNLL